MEQELFAYQLEISKKTATEAQLHLQELLVKRNVLMFIESLPGAIQSIEEQLELQRQAKERMKGAAQNA